MEPNPYPVLDASHDAGALRAMLAEWTPMLAEKERGVAYNERVRALAMRIVAHRAQLFERNARLQVEQPDAAEIGANQTAIKCCTTMLSEMTVAIGHASMPDQER